MVSILILNAGSSTLKWTVFPDGGESSEATKTDRWDGSAAAECRHLVGEAIKAGGDIKAVGHRIVHGGDRFRQPVRIDASTLGELDSLTALAPLHNPPALACVREALSLLPRATQVAAFDTAFHATMPAEATTYALPPAWRENWPVRRYGFHGLSVEYAVQRARALLGQAPRRHIVCHLGAGCSVTAVADQQAVDTSMGFTPLEGVVMATRSGTVDPGLLLFLASQGVSAADLSYGLEHQAGLLGLSQVAGDLRDVRHAAQAGNEAASLALLVFQHSLIRTIGSMAAVLGGVDAVTFTGGIGQHDAALRAVICERLAYLGLTLDKHANNQDGADRDVAPRDSLVRVLVVEAREDISILRAVQRFLS